MASLSMVRPGPSRLSDVEEATCRRAAEADHAYHAMLRASDDQWRRLAMMERRNAIEAELRGDLKLVPPADLWAPIEEVVARELVNIAPTVRTELVMQRRVKRLAMHCGPVQLSLAPNASACRKLRAIKRVSQLCVREIASALGVAERTIERHIAGEKIPQERRTWYRRLDSITVDGDYYHVIVERGAPKRQRWGRNLTRDEKRRILSGADSATHPDVDTL